MMNPDYPIEALSILLDEACLSERYYPLISLREEAIAGLRRLGCVRKSDAERLTDGELASALGDEAAVKLFRRFLSMYDPKPQKFREIAKLTQDPAEQAAFRELYHLPGVRFTRASLYYRSGYASLRDFADTTAAEVLERTALTVERENLSCLVPLPKEARTHIAVARAFCA